MTTNDKEKAATSTREKLLHSLKRSGPKTAAELATVLEVTAVAVRQHLQILVEEELVASEQERQPVGRPAQRWHLTATAQKLFPDNHGKLVTDLLDAIGETYGDDGLRRVVEGRSRRMLERYTPRMPDNGAPLAQRVKVLTGIRNDEGYMAECQPDGTGSWLLIENHCPICSAAENCQEICTSESELFAAILGGNVKITRTEHVLSGNRRCVYEISNGKIER